MKAVGRLAMKGSLKVRKISAPGPGLLWKIKNYSRPKFLYGYFGAKIVAPVARSFGLFVAYGKLKIRHIKVDGSVINYGVVSYNLVTDAFNEFLVDQLQAESSEIGDYKFHDSGEGTTAENASDTDMEVTDGEARATGTQTEGAADEYVSVGTITYSTAKAITEHGLFSQVTGGTLMDRSVFGVVNVGIGDSIEFDYTLALAGS